MKKLRRQTKLKPIGWRVAARHRRDAVSPEDLVPVPGLPSLSTRVLARAARLGVRLVIGRLSNPETGQPNILASRPGPASGGAGEFPVAVCVGRAYLDGGLWRCWAGPGLDRPLAECVTADTAADTVLGAYELEARP